MPNTTNFNWATPADTDLVKDGALAIRTLGSSIDTSLVDLKGGTTGQVLSKNTNTDLDYTWVTPNVGDITEVQAGTGISVASGTGPIPVVTNTVATTYDAKGDLVVGTGADTFAKLTVGTNGHILVADSSVSPTGLKWAVDPVADVVTTAGDLLYATAADTVTRLGIGTAGQVLKVNSGATAPEWGAAAAAGFVGCSVYNTGNQTHSNGADLTVLFSDEFFDTDSFHSTVTNTSRLTIPSGKNGKYFVSCIVGWSADSAGARVIQILKNGNTQIARASSPGVASEGLYLNCFGIFDLVATDYVSLQCYQNSGNSLNVLGGNAQTLFNIVYLGA